MTRQRLLGLTAVLFAVGFGIDLVIGYSPVPGYGAGIGLFGTVLLVYAAKGLGSAFVSRSEDLYPADAPPDVQPDLPPEHDADGTVIGDPAGTLPPASHQRDHGLGPSDGPALAPGAHGSNLGASDDDHADDEAGAP